VSAASDDALQRVFIICLVTRNGFSDDVLLGMVHCQHCRDYVFLVLPEHVGRMSFANVRPFLSGCYPSYGVELLMRVGLQCLSAFMSALTRLRRCCNDDSALAVSASCCPACKDGYRSIGTSAGHLRVLRMTGTCKGMLDGIRTVDGCAAKLSSLLMNTAGSSAESIVFCCLWYMG